MRWYIGGILLVTIIFAALGVFAQVDKGAAQMQLEAGAPGMVAFPHHRHQAVLDDCLVCHSLFAQQKGSIARALAEGQLKQKQVMNKLCIQCHRAQKQAGKPSGPLTCSKCHQK